jgi:hypothetical protein
MVKEEKVSAGEMDRRFVERKLLRGQMTRDQLAEYLATLPDLSGNAEEMVISMEDRSGASKREADAD